MLIWSKPVSKFLFRTKRWWHNASSDNHEFVLSPSSSILLSSAVVRRHQWGGNRHLFCRAADFYQQAKSIRHTTKKRKYLHALCTSSLPWVYFFSCFASLLFVLSSNDLGRKKNLKQAQHLMQFSWHQEPLKDSSGLWNQPAVHRVQRFNKFQGSSQGTATLRTATQNQEPFKYFRRLIIDSLTLSGGHFVEAPLDHGLHVHLCVYARACVRACVGGLSRWTGGIYGRNKVTTETRVSKPGRAISETWHFQVALIRGYHINLTLLSQGPPGRKWVEGRDLESTSQTWPGCEKQGAARWNYWVWSLDTPDGPPIWVDGRKKSPKTAFCLSLDT